MKNIAHQKIKTTSTERINRITGSFKRSRKADQAKMLNRLQYEARFAQDAAVRNWLIEFEHTLKQLGGK